MIGCKLPPSASCVLCGRELAEVGGRRIVSSALRGIGLAERCMGDGDPAYPFQCVPLDGEKDLYVVVWGEPEKWTASAINKVKSEFVQGRHPWFCQLCGMRQCRQCGWPLNVAD